MNTPHTFADALIVVTLAGAFVVWIDLRHQERQRRMEIVHQERVIAMDKGIPLPELPGEPGDAAFGTWLYRITFNHALNVKARMRYRAPHVTTEVLMTAAATTLSPDQCIDEGRRQQAVRACIDELPEVYQSALRLHYWLGASMSEIAVMLDAPENTVKSYLHRARRLLHAMRRQRGIASVVACV